MRNSFKLFFSSFLIISFFSITTIHATTITWLGATANWNDASQWDTGTVPVYGDDVIIPSGDVRISSGDYESATSVEVQVGGRLRIYNGGALEISGAVDNDGLHNMGRVYVYGGLYINDITHTNPAISAKAILNDRYIFTYSTSQINIKYIDDLAILNNNFSYFRARGSIWVYQAEKGALFNMDRFYNSGVIDIEDSGSPSSFSIANSDEFRNYSTGEILVSSDNYSSFDNTEQLRNYGLINLNGTNVGFNNVGTITNYADAELYVEDCGIGYFNRDGGTISNNGRLQAYYGQEAINNYGTIYNHKSITLFYSNGNGGLRNFSSGVIHNNDDIYILGAGYRDVNNEGEININHGGMLEVNNAIDIKSTGIIINDGFMASHFDAGMHIIDGVLENNGAIDDNHGTFPSAVDNQKLIVAPVTGPMYEGVPFPNVLDVTSLTGLTLGTWKISRTGVSAGTYNAVTNEFTPNSNAVGISTIYLSVEDNVSGFNRNFSLEIDGGILALDDDNPMFFQEKETTTSIQRTSSEVIAFPNPSTGSLQLKSELFDAETTQVQVFNTLGQLVQGTQFAAGGFTQTLEFERKLSNGIYLIKLIQNGKEVNIQRVQLQR